MLRLLRKSLYLQVLIGIALGIALGLAKPEWGAEMKPLGDLFIRLIRMVVVPVVFVTVALGIAKMGEAKGVGRVALKALLYFEVLSTLALVIGLGVAHLYQPGAGIHFHPQPADAESIAQYTRPAGGAGGILSLIPETMAGAFASGDILQVLLISVLSGIVLLQLGTRVKPLVDLLEQLAQYLFALVALIVRLAPVGAFGAMAFTIGKFGPRTLLSLGSLMAGVYTTCILFVAIVLGGVAKLAGFSLWRFLVYIKDELVIVLGTSSSESVLPRLMEKLEGLGCDKPLVGLVVPTGYSFNLDGTSIYMTMATVFLAQAMDVHLSFGRMVALLGVLLLTSKGAATVTGGGFITLAATLAATNAIPVEGMALLLGVDRFMSEARALTNLIGNGVATLAIARWEGRLDREKLAAGLAGATSSSSAARGR